MYGTWATLEGTSGGDVLDVDGDIVLELFDVRSEMPSTYDGLTLSWDPVAPTPHPGLRGPRWP